MIINRTVQPASVVGIAGSSLTQGLVLAGYGYSDRHDVADKNMWTSTSATKATTRSARAWSFNGTTSYISRTDAPLNTASKSYSFACLATPRGTITAGARIFAFGSSLTTTPFVAIESTGILTVRDDGAVITSTAALANPPALDRESLLIAVFKPAVMTLYEWTSSVTVAIANTACTTNRSAIGALLRTTASNFFSGDVSWWAAWNREITPYEIANLRENPWQIFAPMQRRFYFEPAAAGGTLVGPLIRGGRLQHGSLIRGGVLT